MPLTYFICPDGVKRPIIECLNKCPRPEGRCLSLPVLHGVGYDRPFNKPSVTQCLNPTRIEYLKITCNYATNPVEHAFALLGTSVHRRLEIIANLIEGLKAEHKVEDSDTIGTLDLLEPDELYEGSYKLIDMKCWGSYSVAKVLGRKQNGESDIAKASLQLNGYRIKVEPLGIPVSRMFIMAIVRDGGTYTAKNNNVPEKMLMIPIDKMPDDYVKDYFSQKSQSLIEALDKKQLPSFCSFEDRWGGRRCKGYCDVFNFCPEGAMLNKVKLEV
jgi:hypothetical protein